MPGNVPERLAVVETKVQSLEQLHAKVDMVCDYVLAEKTRKSFLRNGLVAIGGFIAASGTVWEIFGKK